MIAADLHNCVDIGTIGAAKASAFTSLSGDSKSAFGNETKPDIA
jgi:hypothetical protein